VFASLHILSHIALPQSYRARNYKPRKPIDLLLMSSHSKISNSTESFACKVHNLYVEIIKQIQASNEQDLHKNYDAFNVWRLFHDTD